MYLKYFKLKKQPFHITPDPEFLFLSPSHQEASASILYGIEHRKGFITITGEVGVGKTTILRSYLEGTDPGKLRVVYIFNSATSFQKLLKQIFLELGIPIENDEPSDLVDSLFLFLIEEYKNGRNIILIVDEAQNMPVETLEHLRMLSNLETSKDKLLQIVLVGQPEFEIKLNLPELRQLKQRVAIQCHIDALSREESLAYIQHRIFKASMFHNPIFTKGALNRIVKEARGIPRVINILCDNALITSYGYERKPADLRIVKEVIADMHGRRPRSLFRWRMALIPALVIVISIMLVFFRDNLAPPKTAQVKKVLPIQTHATENTSEPQSALLPKSEPQSALVPKSVSTKGEPALELPSRLESEQSSQTLVDKAQDSMNDVPVPEQTISQFNDAPITIKPTVVRQDKSCTARVIQRGESIYGLLTTGYGRLDQELVKSFRDLNPQIADLNRIKAGEKVFLPLINKTNLKPQ